MCLFLSLCIKFLGLCRDSRDHQPRDRYRDRHFRDRDETRDRELRDRDETETLAKMSETRPRRDPKWVSRLSRDRDPETESASLVQCKKS